MTVTGKVIAITGAAGGLGAEMARLLSAHGAIIHILDLNEEQGVEVAAELTASGGKAAFHHLDVADEVAWERVIGAIVATDGRLDVLVNNAGINIRKPIEEMVFSEFSTMMAVNVGSVFLGTKFAIPVMRKQGGGAIINTSSVCGLVGHKYTPEAYTTTKGAVTLLTKAIASRYGGDNIRCNSIHPSTVDTPLVQEMFKDPAKKQERLDEVPLGRLASSLDVAHAVLYLASDEAAFLNGVALPIDGGVTAY